MKKRILDAIVLLVGLAALAASLGVYRNLGIYADEHNASMIQMVGGEGWLYLNAAVPLCLLVICVITIIRLLRKK